jgi:hypothetical protein
MKPSEVWIAVLTQLLTRLKVRDLYEADVIRLGELADVAVVEYARRQAPDYFYDLVNAHLGAESTSAASAAQPSGDQA